MPLSMPCPNCGTVLQVSEDTLGKMMSCGRCQQVFTAQRPASMPTPSAPPLADRGPALRPAPAPAEKSNALLYTIIAVAGAALLLLLLSCCGLAVWWFLAPVG